MSDQKLNDVDQFSGVLMGSLHQLISAHGRDAARQMVPDTERSLVDMAAEVMAAEPTIGLAYTGFALTSLPHRKPKADTDRWERRSASVTLTIDPGSLPDGTGASKVHGVPYGSRARMILLYLQSRAVQTGSPEIELGRSMREWLDRMAIPIGGKSMRDIREQADRISACTLTFAWRGGDKVGFVKDSIVRGGIQIGGGDDGQPRLWVDTVHLSETFFRELRDHAIPLADAALRALSSDSPAIDVYIWLAYRLHILDRPTPVSWVALHAQFGFGYSRLRDFRRYFEVTLASALAVYPDAHVDVDHAGIVLHPSRPPIPARVGHSVVRE